MASLILFSLVVVFSYMTLWWLMALVKKRNDIADVAWGLGFIVIAVSLLAKTSNYSLKSYILLSMVCVWGLRLALHISKRHKHKAEDARYVKMRSEWKYPKLQSYSNVFLLQGFFMLLVAVPIIIFFYGTNQKIEWYNIIGLGIWLIGFLFESISDYQLSKFINKRKNSGKIMRYGLWKYSRHPNYFGEISLWWGFYIFTLFMSGWGFAAAGPITISFLILGVSGIPILEARYRNNKEYQEYQRTTSAFFPTLPKK